MVGGPCRRRGGEGGEGEGIGRVWSGGDEVGDRDSLLHGQSYDLRRKKTLCLQYTSNPTLCVFQVSANTQKADTY